MSDMAAIKATNPDSGDLLSIVQLTAMNVNGISEQMGLIVREVNGMRDSIRAVKADLGEFRADASDRLVHLEEDQFVDLIKADNIKRAAQCKVAELLGIEFDERGGVTPESQHDYTHYYSKFVGRLHCDARNAGLEGPRIYATPRRNYKALIDFIAGWVPRRGVDGLKSYYDGLEAARRSKRA